MLDCGLGKYLVRPGEESVCFFHFNPSIDSSRTTAVILLALKRLVDRFLFPLPGIKGRLQAFFLGKVVALAGHPADVYHLGLNLECPHLSRRLVQAGNEGLLVDTTYLSTFSRNVLGHHIVTSKRWLLAGGYAADLFVRL